MKTAHPTLSRRASYWVSAGVVVNTLWTSGAPTMSYPLFAAEWHLTATSTEPIFAVFPIVVAIVLTGFGNVSDYIGLRAAMLLGLCAALVGALLFAIAPNIGWLYLGRALMGAGVGLSAGASSAAVVAFSAPGQESRGNATTTAAQGLGFALATLVGGALVQYAPFPTRLSFCVLIAFIAVLTGATWFLPRQTAGAASGRWRPKAVDVPRALRRVFMTSATMAIVCYTLGALLLSIGAQVARDLVGSGNVL
jgi:MFS family permease